MDHYQGIVKAIEEFNNALVANVSHGACDSEVFYSFRYVVRQAIKGRDPYVPRSRREWELYENPGANEAAQTLYHAATKVVNAIRSCPIMYVSQVQELIDKM